MNYRFKNLAWVWKTIIIVQPKDTFDFADIEVNPEGDIDSYLAANGK